MIVKVEDKVYPFDDYLDIYNSVQKLADECYKQGRADARAEVLEAIKTLSGIPISQYDGAILCESETYIKKDTVIALLTKQ